MKNSPLALSLALTVVLSACSEKDGHDVQPLTAVASAAAIANADELVYDMTGQHEAQPHGVPSSYDWAQGPRIGMGNRPYHSNGTAFRAIIPWGQIYETVEGNPASNVRVQIRGMKAYIRLKSTHAWTLLYNTSDFGGAQYREDFANDNNQPAAPRDESGNGGGLSVKTGGGYNYHFWPKSGRADINPDDIEGVFTTFEARLILDNPSGPDQRSTARYIASGGADYWLDKTAEWNNFLTNGDCAMGKFKNVTASWRSFSMHTITPAANIKNIPPPGVGTTSTGTAPVADGLYTLTPECGTGMRLDVNNGRMADRTDVRTWHANNNPAQNWRVQRQDDGSYRLSAANDSNFVLDVSGSGASNRTEVHLYRWNGTNAQRWLITDAGNGYFKLVPKSSPGFALDVEGASGSPTNVWLWQDLGNSAQKWRFTPVTNP